MSLFTQLLLPRIPLLLKSIAVATVISIYRGTIESRAIITLSIVIFQSLTLLSNLSSSVGKSVDEGMGYGIGGMMVGGATKTVSQPEEGRAICPSCEENPYSIESLKKIAMRSLPPGHQSIVTRVLPQGLLPTDEPDVSEIIKQPQEVKVFRVGDEMITLCQALVRAGFNPNWTIQDVRELKQTNIAKLQEINNKVREMTGIKNIRNEDIIRCFPHYYTDYVCRKTVRAEEEIPTTKFTYQQKAKHCNLSKINEDLYESVKSFYSRGRELNAEKDAQTLININYVTQRGMLEIKKLINLYQNKSKKQWLEFYTAEKAKNNTGYKIAGTAYMIPWSLFYKYSVCFGY